MRTRLGQLLLRDDLAGPGVHSGWSAKLDEPAIVATVLDDGRTASLHAFVGCRFVTTTGPDGSPYRFALNGFGTAGTGRGPVYPGLGTPPVGHVTAAADTQYGGPWYGGKVFWYALPRYRGPALIRGRRLDGDGALGFNGQASPRRELHIRRGVTVSWTGQVVGSRGIPSDIRVLQPGCYGVRIDGTTFSRVVVFQVETQQP